ncbi:MULTISPECIES: aspartate carbamoyltransferase regulatory subunit [unclassified Motilimonas]|uniref:aspartate carbamoyltransferase regulatory subunit n=1 Tax=Motilimonas TaxID=1914248 RepID=UPI001E485BCE|nr:MULTISPECIES: aspartate carbamoyltransferase regulatory subunit [unclassified Motilimonas]MCE0558906.1 aspartate carbamoyltransferase regulatory subunit [Motilimonas sp. E26]MDO6527050.1 aspartate carbamoyltransferase regulatory subunit [Motilimonas sp. 1_MG-2023]
MKKKLEVQAIENGSVIDHIAAGKGVKILKFFQLTDTNQKITIGLNLPTGGNTTKDLIKIENTQITGVQANQLALFAPDATINLIDDYDVVKKFKVALPEAISGVLACPNSNCISHNEPVDSLFYIKQKQQIKLKCHYCEKSFATSFFKELD